MKSQLLQSSSCGVYLTFVLWLKLGELRLRSTELNSVSGR